MNTSKIIVPILLLSLVQGINAQTDRADANVFGHVICIDCDEDLHIETSGSEKVIHQNSPDLKQEKSRSYMASFDFNRRIRQVYIEMNAAPADKLSLKTGFTVQSSM